MNKYTILVKKSGKHYVGLCLELNISSQGETLIEAKEQMNDAMEDYISYLNDSNNLDKIEPVDFETLKDFLLNENELVKLDNEFAFSENYVFEVRASA